MKRIKLGYADLYVHYLRSRNMMSSAVTVEKPYGSARLSQLDTFKEV